MELSYSQNLEDYHLSLAFAGQTRGTYIDVGAGHPIADNVSYWFYERGWQGIVVEPQPELAALYQRLRPRDLAREAVVRIRHVRANPVLRAPATLPACPQNGRKQP